MLQLFSSRTCTYALLCCACGSAFSCVREHSLFIDDPAAAGASGDGGDDSRAGSGGGTSEDGGAPGPGGAGAGQNGGAGSGGGGAAWDKASCIEALSSGKNGDVCTGPFNCSATVDCCSVSVACKVGSLVVQNACDLCKTSCAVDADCATGEICDAYSCLSCPEDACPDLWSKVLRNSCAVCVPPTECKADKECGLDERCVPGASCLPSCKADPACCFGNRCASASCGAPTGVDCLLVGCSAGQVCKAGPPGADCSCDPKLGTWSCSPAPVSECVTR